MGLPLQLLHARLRALVQLLNDTQLHLLIKMHLSSSYGEHLPLILENLEIHRSRAHPNTFTKINTNRIKSKCVQQFKESYFMF